MKCLKRNKRDVWFANRLSDEYVTDGNGLKTGEKRQTYGTPVKARMSFEITSGAQGGNSLSLHGIVTEYSAKAVTEHMDCQMNEESKVWFGILPTSTVTVVKTVDGETVTEEQEEPVPHNYVVIRRVPSLNFLTFYLKEVTTS